MLLTERSSVRAVYRVKQDGSLRRLRRWPRVLNDEVPKIKPKTKDDVMMALGLRMTNLSFGNAEVANDLTKQWAECVDSLGCCIDHANELSTLSPREIKSGQEAGYLDKPITIDAIREYKARLGYAS